MKNAQEIDRFQHQDFIWTWKSNRSGSRVSLWLPYFEGVEKVKGSTYAFSYNGGAFETDLKRVDFIMLYGATGSLPVDFLDALNTQRITLFVHRRNMPRPYIFNPGSTTDDLDTLSRQIMFRENGHKAAYIARTLMAARFHSMGWIAHLPQSRWIALRQLRNIDRIRALEAQVSKRYWQVFFDELGVDASRRGDGPWKSALDAGSMFLYGVLLRWILFHKLSPAHGYLHLPTSYPSLAYDLMEPYRYLIEQACAYATAQNTREQQLVAGTIAQLKRLLDVPVYVPATRQFVRRKNLLHGCVLALRSYLLGGSRRFVLPVEGVRAGGRPPKVDYTLPGALPAQ